jgi:hypothetical protein
MAELGLGVVLAVVGIMLLEGMWLAFLTFMMYRRAREAEAQHEAELWRRENATTIDEIFLVHRSGLLIRHETRRLKPDVDKDVLSAMFLAVQEFVKDSFRGERGDLDEIRFGELRILIVRGKHSILAAVVSGKRPLNIIPQMEAAIADVEKRMGSVLADWSGVVDDVADCDTIMKALIRGDYDRSSPEDEGPTSPRPLLRPHGPPTRGARE